MVLSGSEKAPDSFSEFYKQARDAGLIGKLEPNVSYQKIFDYFLGENAVKVEMVNGKDTNERLESGLAYKPKIDYDMIGGYLNDSKHWMFFDNAMKLFDAGLPQSNGPRKHAWEVKDWVIEPGQRQKIDYMYIVTMKYTEKLYK
jgi:hypothetical protein